ncbi:Ssb Single-strand DNA-binding protein [Bifidobacterium adolescentis JCM 15918]|uniref:Single-stranded DNA-binding protein n=1 Tax=Bifidobacterium adolescentis JCM 15918 TaxID=1437612 RepID=A0A087DKJ3_BIFAD|nr:single-stranded DNA-binding protein [Bifidobacterium adolescentis]KFI96043.1 Ssb Single-strand DNA-binding protein [Bifidobacterium adolescentis JCM 15918]
MAGETVITIVGNLTADPELRTTRNGGAVANFSIAATPRVFDKQSNQWVDGDALFMRCTAWRDLATHCAQSLAKGMRVIAHGRLTQHSWEDEQHQKRTAVELQVDEIGPSLRYATAQVQKMQSGGYQATPMVAAISSRSRHSSSRRLRQMTRGALRLESLISDA